MHLKNMPTEFQFDQIFASTRRLTVKSLLLVVYIAVEIGNPYFQLGYNSFGAFATIPPLLPSSKL
ncbi:GDP-L-galactose phosphorylase 2-like, partial [Olea europaea subsp. europaea]